MKNFQEKRRWRNIMESRPVLVFLCFVVFVFAYSVFGLLGKMRETVKNKQTAENKILELQETKERLLANIGKLETEKGKEESIREKFGWVKEGEGIIVVVEEKNLEDEDRKSKSGGFFSFFKNLFK